MQTAADTPIHSADFKKLQGLFDSLQKPYGHGDIVRFNLAYQRLYPQLSRDEKCRAEELVDALMADPQQQDLAAKICAVE